MNKVNVRTLEGEGIPKKKSLTIPAIVAIVCLLGLFWTVDHIAGNCLTANDVLRYCPIN